MLPGGLWEGGTLRRDFAFQSVDGVLELALAEVGTSAISLPAAVTAALCAGLKQLAGGPASPERVRALCVADRQYLMRALEQHLGCVGGWQAARCRHCDESFDFYLDYTELPVVEAEPGFPFVELVVSGESWRFRLPNGGDQEQLHHLEGAEALRALLMRCRLASEYAELKSLTDQQLDDIDAAMDAVSPGVVTEVDATCPSCGTSNLVSLNPYAVLGRSLDNLLVEVHQLAYHYHWGEREILSLPRSRRHQYLRLIDRARGMMQ